MTALTTNQALKAMPDPLDFVVDYSRPMPVLDPIWDYAPEPRFDEATAVQIEADVANFLARRGEPEFLFSDDDLTLVEG